MKAKNTLMICLYSGVQTWATNVYIFDKNNNRKDISESRYIVEHIFEIILPYVEQYPNHDISIRLDGKHLEYSDIEQSYYDSMND